MRIGAAGLIEIKRRLKSVQSTRKITKAMGLVATSKLRKSRRELLANGEFAKAARNTLLSLAFMAEDQEQLKYFNGNNGKKALYIVVNSDSGLCAGYNNNVINKLVEVTSQNRDNVEVIAVGSKGLSTLKRLGFNTVSQYVNIPDIPTVKEVRLIFENAIKLFENEEVSEVNVVYTQFISPIRQDVKVEKILPVENAEVEYGDKFIEPSIDVVMKSAIEVYLKGEIRNVLLTSKCSEFSARMNAMDGATRNADDILSALNIKYNRVRQAAITQEISEIVGGAEAQK